MISMPGMQAFEVALPLFLAPGLNKKRYKAYNIKYMKDFKQALIII